MEIISCGSDKYPLIKGTLLAVIGNPYGIPREWTIGIPGNELLEFPGVNCHITCIRYGWGATSSPTSGGLLSNFEGA